MAKYILITGVSTGIGFASARKFLAEGYYVFGSVRKATDAQKLQEEYPNTFEKLVFDIQDIEAIKASFEIVSNRVGSEGLSCLVNNAGIAVSGPILHVSIEDLAYQFDVNVMGLVRVTQVYAPLLGAGGNLTKNKGKIINISSVSGVITRSFMGPYSGSKHAVEAISDAMRRELMLYGVDVVVIQPGPIKTPIWDKARNKEVMYQDTDYASIFAKMEKAVDTIEGVAIEVNKVSDLIFKTYSLSKPKTRYLIAPKQWFFRLIMHFLPDRMLDKRMFEDYKKLMS